MTDLHEIYLKQKEKELREEIETRLSVLQWQPIETAPLNGTRIDVWVIEDHISYRVADCYYSDYLKEWVSEKGNSVQARFWMPIPKGPSK